MDIEEKHGEVYNAARIYHQMGMIAQKKQDYDSAENWYRKVLDVFEKHAGDNGAASTYHQRGMFAQEKRDYDFGQIYKHSFLLGRIAQEKRDYDSAEGWYRKALDMCEKLGNGHGAARILSLLGILNRDIGNFEQSGKSLLMGVEKFSASGDGPMAMTAMEDFLRTLEKTPADIQMELRRLCRERGLTEVEKNLWLQK